MSRCVALLPSPPLLSRSGAGQLAAAAPAGEATAAAATLPRLQRRLEQKWQLQRQQEHSRIAPFFGGERLVRLGGSPSAAALFGASEESGRPMRRVRGSANLRAAQASEAADGSVASTAESESVAATSAAAAPAAPAPAFTSTTTVPAAPPQPRAVTAADLVVAVGWPLPLGPSPLRESGGATTAAGSGPRSDSIGVNFALFSQHATSVTLCLFLEGQRNGAPDKEIFLDASKHRTGDVWHVSVKGLPLKGVNYCYRVDGPRGWESGHRFDPSVLLVDPYAPLLDGRRTFGDAKEKLAQIYGTFDFESEPFDWGDDDLRPRIKDEDVVVYEMNVRAFTADGSSGLQPDLRGSYRGVAEKVSHLVDLGVNSVELLPIFEYDEFEFQRRPNPRDHMVNTWGYSTINFFAPMMRYGSGGKGPAAASRELKEMVKTLHASGIEVILDVVYNHTNESDDQFPYTTSFRGIDNTVYYIVNTSDYVQLANYAGCGNTLNCNHPVVMQLILDSLRHWVTEYHVDGFRFDLASVLCRGLKGEPLAAPPLIRAIAKDEILSKCKLIAEPWDCGGLYQVGCFPNWDKWAEWNGKYRDDVRKFIKGDYGMKGGFATRLAGSADMYHVNNRKPYHSVNFVIAHDGFTLRDLVSYNAKHNEANGEQGRDGSNDNFSWNCGVEGETTDANVLALRARQMRNFHLALMLSQGTPMMLMGDEYGHTRHGNNNSYGHDTALNHFLWGQLESERGSFFRFTSLVNRLRTLHPALGQPNFLSPTDIQWHEDNWGNLESKFLAFTLYDKTAGQRHLYAAFNAHDYFVDAALPSPPSGRAWARLVDTNLPPPKDIVDVDLAFNQSNCNETLRAISGRYNIAPFSAIVLMAFSPN